MRSSIEVVLNVSNSLWLRIEESVVVIISAAVSVKSSSVVISGGSMLIGLIDDVLFLDTVVVDLAVLVDPLSFVTLLKYWHLGPLLFKPEKEL